MLPSKKRLEGLKRLPEVCEVWMPVVCELIGLLLDSEEGRSHKTFKRLLTELRDLLVSEKSGTGVYAGTLSQTTGIQLWTRQRSEERRVHNC